MTYSVSCIISQRLKHTNGSRRKRTITVFVHMHSCSIIHITFNEKNKKNDMCCYLIFYVWRFIYRPNDTSYKFRIPCVYIRVI